MANGRRRETARDTVCGVSNCETDKKNTRTKFVCWCFSRHRLRLFLAHRSSLCAQRRCMCERDALVCECGCEKCYCGDWCVDWYCASTAHIYFPSRRTDDAVKCACHSRKKNIQLRWAVQFGRTGKIIKSSEESDLPFISLNLLHSLSHLPNFYIVWCAVIRNPFGCVRDRERDNRRMGWRHERVYECCRWHRRHRYRIISPPNFSSTSHRSHRFLAVCMRDGLCTCTLSPTFRV